VSVAVAIEPQEDVGPLEASDLDRRNHWAGTAKVVHAQVEGFRCRDVEKGRLTVRCALDEKTIHVAPVVAAGSILLEKVALDPELRAQEHHAAGPLIPLAAQAKGQPGLAAATEGLNVVRSDATRSGRSPQQLLHQLRYGRVGHVDHGESGFVAASDDGIETILRGVGVRYVEVEVRVGANSGVE